MDLHKPKFANSNVEFSNVENLFPNWNTKNNIIQALREKEIRTKHLNSEEKKAIEKHAKNISSIRIA